MFDHTVPVLSLTIKTGSTGQLISSPFVLGSSCIGESWVIVCLRVFVFLKRYADSQTITFELLYPTSYLSLLLSFVISLSLSPSIYLYIPFCINSKHLDCSMCVRGRAVYRGRGKWCVLWYVKRESLYVKGREGVKERERGDAKYSNGMSLLSSKYG